MVKVKPPTQNLIEYCRLDAPKIRQVQNQNLLINPHGIAMPKSLYFTAVVFFCFFFFLRRLISEVTERISTKLGHIFTYDCYLNELVQTLLGIYPPPTTRAGGKYIFGDRLSTLTEHISSKEHDINNQKKNLSIYKDTLRCHQNLMNFDQ